MGGGGAERRSETEGAAGSGERKRSAARIDIKAVP